MRAVCATTAPVISLASPCTKAAQAMSPPTRPSKCKSAFAVRSPVMAMSGPSTEKVASVAMPLAGCRAVESGFFENIRNYLQKRTRIDGLVVEPDLEMQMRTGGAAGASDRSDHLAGHDAVASPRAERGHVGVARPKAVAVVDLDDIAIARALADEGDLPAGGGENRRAHRGLEIKALVERGAAVERVGAIAEARRNISRGRGNDPGYSIEAALQRLHPRKAEPEAAEARIERTAG